MTPINFCYWLQGYFELGLVFKTPEPSQTAIIKDHLELVEATGYSLDDVGARFVVWLAAEFSYGGVMHWGRVNQELSKVFSKKTPNYLNTAKASFEKVMTGGEKIHTNPLPYCARKPDTIIC